MARRSLLSANPRLVILAVFATLALVGFLAPRRARPSDLGEYYRWRGDDADAQRQSLLPDDKSVLLTTARPALSSQNGRFTLRLLDNGDVVLQSVNGSSRPVWATMTGDGGAQHMLVVEKPDDRVRVAVVRAAKGDAWETLWHSDLEPACRNATAEGVSGEVTLSNDGRLSVAGLCDLYAPPAADERSLAVVVAGMYRTNHAACKSHMEHLVAGHPAFARIDVFAYVLYEADDVERNRTPSAIEAAVKTCYGDHLRGVRVADVADSDVELPGDVPDTPCGDRLARVGNQLRTVDLAASEWWAWTVREGYTHDMVLRLRPDTLLTAKPEFWAVEQLGHNTVALPHGHDDKYLYCPQPSGRIGIGSSDQIAYGSPAAMNHWFQLSRSFPQAMALATNPDSPAHRDFSGCEVLPSGPEAGDCPQKAACSIECLTPWYLESRGVATSVEWAWKQSVLTWAEADRL